MRLPRLQTLDSWRQYPNYRYLWTGNLFSNGAQWLQLFTAGWLVWELSKDTGTTGLFVASLGAINLLPSILIGPIGGVLGDRFNRKYLIMILQSFMACVAILFALLNTTDLVEVWHVYAYVIVSGCCLCICQPMRNALVANTVPREMIGNAMAVNVFTITGTRMIGPFFGGILIANLGFQWNFGIEACLYLGTVIALIRLKLPYREASKPGNQIGVFQSLKEGISYIRKEDRTLLNLITLSVIPELLLHPVWLLIPLFVAQVLGEGPEIAGFLWAVTGLGGLTSTILFSSFGYIIKKGYIVLGAAILGSVAVILYANSTWAPLAFFLIALMSFGQSAFRTTNSVLIQSLAPDEYRLRISTLLFHIKGFIIIPCVLAGLLIDFTSVRIGITCLGTIGLLLGIYFTFTFHRVRKLL